MVSQPVHAALHFHFDLLGTEQLGLNHERGQLLQAGACEDGTVKQHQAALDQVFESLAPFLPHDPPHEAER